MDARDRFDTNNSTLSEKLINVNRVAKVVKGGKILSFTAIVVSGDGNGHVGLGMGKAREVAQAIRKAGSNAKKNLIEVPMKGYTIPHYVEAKYGASKVLLKPASPGTGVLAGGAVRAIVVSAGIKDILTKSLKSTNPINLGKATILALQQLKVPEETKKSA
ncbi:MAG: 30S ribosomal protein S5 [Chloroflexi bacterium]|nr:30S ribosomal protein S5 [Chloroflexota bacterium]